MSNKSFYISLILLLTTIAGACLISQRGKPVVVATNLENLPLEITGFKATKDAFSESVYKELNADIHVYRHYRSTDGMQIDLYIGYYGTIKGGRTGHNPYACLPGAGWAIIDSSKVHLAWKHCPNSVNVNYIVAHKGGAENIIIHWYQSAGRKVLTTGIQQNISRFIGKVINNRNDGAFVRVSAFSTDSHIREAKSQVTFFAQEILNLLPEYWPTEQ